ncbi:MAG: amino acid ABC transporter permease, partial [Pseudomonadota bacterium]
MSPQDTTAFVRTSEIPPSPPPATETGVVKWLRENLFSSPASSVLTILALIAIYYLGAALGPWLLNGVWSADSLSECRQVLDGATGGCFAVIGERWHQLLFGFYPPEGYWRLVLAFILLAVAAAPVMVSTVPRQLLYFTAVFPFIAYWLIWGGTLWFPISVILGFVAGGFVYTKVEERSFVIAVAAGIVTAILWWSLLAGPFAGILSSILPLALMEVESRNIGGFTTNFILGITCISLSLPLGILLALGRQSGLFVVRTLCVVFIEFIRGVPLITLLFVANVVLAYFLPPGTTFDLILRVIIMITLFASAYIAEVIRGGLAALPKGQYEAADALGLDYWKAMRFIILPQALKISIPGIVNVAIGLFKDTTLVSVISMFDMIGLIRGPILADAAWNGVYWELFGFAALLFF